MKYSQFSGDTFVIEGTQDTFNLFLDPLQKILSVMTTIHNATEASEASGGYEVDIFHRKLFCSF